MKSKFLLVFILLTVFFGACGKFLKKEDEKTNVSSSKKYYNYKDLYKEIYYTAPPFESYNTLFFDKNFNYKGISREDAREIKNEDVEKEISRYRELFNNIQENIENSPKYEFDDNAKNIVELTYEIKEKLLEIKKSALVSTNLKMEKLNHEYYLLLKNYDNQIKEFTIKFEQIDWENQEIFFQKLISEGSSIEEKKEIFKTAAKIFIGALYTPESLQYIKENREISERLKELQKILEVAELDIELELEKYTENIEEEMKNLLFLEAIRELVERSKDIVQNLENNSDEKELISKINSFIIIYARNVEGGMINLKIDIM